jgi:hypothetical protein
LHHIPIFELHILYPHIFPYDPHIFPLDHIYILYYIYTISPLDPHIFPYDLPRSPPFFVQKRPAGIRTASWNGPSVGPRGICEPRSRRGWRNRHPKLFEKDMAWMAISGT